MKKGLLLGALLLGAASFSMLTGFDSAATAEDVLQKYVDSSKNVEKASADADFVLDASIAVPAADMTMGLSASGTEAIAMTMDPLAMKADASFDVSMMGQNLNVKVSIYGVTEEDGSFALYVLTDTGEGDAQWQKTATDAAQIQELIEKASTMQLDVSSLPLSFELAPAAVDVNGTECYELYASMGVADLLLVAQPYMDQIIPEGQGITAEDIQTIGSLLSGIQFNISLDVDAETYKPMKVHLDLDGSDWTTIAALLASSFGTDDAGNPYEVNLDVNAVALDIVYDYESPVEISVPEEALGAAEADPDSLLEMVEDAAA